ncbi:hypothetical protein [Streptomyces sp. TM32]|uniref:hypothetical protein n=1 Tax=Streptomyces sp. TM32 TaxID=1652669 RepID=UPI001C20BAE6|nr:hypothetical protein [Streptomyces sp. TM32]
MTDLRLSPEQLAALNAELAEVVDRHRAAARCASGAGETDGQPVLVQLQSFPRKERGER